ncbi:N-(5'-phosphoribosyl)anthranilate isomerase [Ruegeria sp. SCSIO 43209]|nr:N-(5'-phosphoribosyl)anthranilate isomerase [Ruegeria sp. SCSIO 43209]
MMTYRSDPEPWITQLISSRSARTGAVVRRLVAWVEREVGHAAFQAEVKRRGYHLIRTANQYVIICHNGPIDILF